MYSRVTFFFLVFLMLGGCQSYQKNEPEKWSPQEQDIIEAVFRYQLEKFSPFFNTSIVCLSWGYPLNGVGIDKSNDPTDEFISRFVGYQPPVAKLSSCSLSKEDECFNVVDVESGLDGLIFDVVSIDYVGNEKAEVEGGYTKTCVSSDGHLFTVELVSEEWTVTGDILLWMS